MIKKIFVTIWIIFLFGFLAVDGVFAESCSPNGSFRCSGYIRQECDGVWGYYETCPGTCTDGSCDSCSTGSCDVNNPCCRGLTCNSSYYGTCVVEPTSIITAVPTGETCGGLTDSCNLSNPCCSLLTCFGNECIEPCDGSKLGYNFYMYYCTGVAGVADIGGWATRDCYYRNENNDYSTAPFQWPGQYVGEAICPAGSNDEDCSPFTCYNAPNEDICPGFDPVATCGGPGNCDNCGGPDCGWCGGVDPGTITPTPGCVANCLDTNANTCVPDTCIGSSCQSTCPGIFCNGTKEQAQTCTGSGIQYIETPQHTGSIWARIYGVSADAENVKFPTWSSLNGQDDIAPWYVGSKIDPSCGSNCTWQTSIDLSRHTVSSAEKFVNVHSYIDGCGTTNSPCSNTGGFTISEKTCSVTVVKTGDQTFSVTVSGDGSFNPGTQTGRLWVERQDGASIANYDIAIVPATTEAISNGHYYYNFPGANLSSTDSALVSKTINVTLPGGDYFFHCDMPEDIDGNFVKCSGNPFCPYEGYAPATSCNNWKSCSNSDNAAVCSEGETCALKCNQNKDCGRDPCSGTDAGIPATPIIVSPSGSAFAPITLSDNTPRLEWDGNDPLTDSYEINVINPSGAVVWTGNAIAGGANNVSVGTALSSNITYRWYVRALNSTCSPYGQNLYSLPSGYGYFRINTPPVIGAFSIYNSVGEMVMPESEGRNHICQSDFKNNRNVNFQLSVTDIDGPNDIIEVALSWNGQTYILDRGTTWATGAIYSRSIDYGSYNNSGLYQISASARDNSETVTVDTGRWWKVWNCQVPVRGNIYDGSADHSCVGGFTNLADSAMNFNALIFNNSTESITATVSVPNAFGTNNLFWGRKYLPLINGGTPLNPDGDLAATGRMTRFVGSGIPGGSCLSDNMVNVGNVDPYGADPVATVDFSYIRDQEGWYQVRGGGIRAGDSIQSGVPVTANPLERYLTLGKSLPTTINNGLVSYAVSFSNTNGYNDEAYGSPNSWWKNSSLLPATRYGYQYFYKNLYVNAGVGVTGTAWDEKPSEGVFFVNGNLTIDTDFILPAGRFFMVVVSGNITITNGVTRLDGIYVSDGELAATGNATDNALIINGMLFSKNNIKLGRSFAEKSLNNNAPATIVNYSPDLIFNMPIKISKIISGWRED